MLLLAHALPQSVGAVPLTLLLTLVAGLLLGVNAWATRQTSRQTSRQTRTRLHQPPAVPAAGDQVEAPAEDDPRPRTGQLIGLALLVVLALLATAGTTDPAENLADELVLTQLWGVVAISTAFLGRWWWRVNPVRALGGLLSRAVGDPEQELAHPLPQRLGTVAAVGGLLTWALAQLLVHPSTTTFQLLLLGYVCLHLAGSARYGLAWIQQAEPLEVVSAALGPARIRGVGPLRRLSTVPDGDRLRAVCAALVAWSLTDLVIETEAWHALALAPTAATAATTLLLLAGTAVLYGVIRAASGRIGLGPAFVAVAAAWVFSHHLSLLLVEGQGIPIWLSDPLGTGADLLGRRGARVDPEPIGVTALAAVQMIPFVLGHLAATVVVQRRAAAVARTAGQLGVVVLPARVVIGVLLLGGTYLQLGGV